MGGILQAVDHCFCYYGNMLVLTSAEEKNLLITEAAFSALCKLTVKLKQSKPYCYIENRCTLACRSMLMAFQQRRKEIDGITSMPKHKNIAELRLLLYMVKYYVKFLSDLLTELTSLHSLFADEESREGSRCFGE